MVQQQMEINEDQPKAIYSELAIARETATIAAFSETEGQAEKWERFIMEKGKTSVCPNWTLLSMGS